MDTLALQHLTTLTLDVDFRGIQRIGAVPVGQRGVAHVTGGRFEGTRLNGTVLGGHDWFVNRPDGIMTIDVRLTMQTADAALIYLTYQGRFLAEPAVMARFAKGEMLEASEYSLAMIARFECGHADYRWLNDVVAVGQGTQTRTGPIYRIFQAP